jgi:hypothetical protein
MLIVDHILAAAVTRMLTEPGWAFVAKPVHIQALLCLYKAIAASQTIAQISAFCINPWSILLLQLQLGIS